MTIETKELFLGDYITFNLNGNQMYGRIIRRVSDGNIESTLGNSEVVGTENNPAYIVNLISNYQTESEDTGLLFVITEKEVQRVPAPQSVMQEVIEDILDDITDENNEEYEDASYEADKLAMVDTLNERETLEAMSIGDYVSFEVAEANFRGRIIDISNDKTLISSAGYKLDGMEADPAVLIRLYNENEDGDFEESDFKVVHRMSSLLKIPVLNSKKESICEKNKKTNKREVKVFAFNIHETKEVEIEGQRYGLVRGYASTYNNIDRGNDSVLPGAFKKSLQRYIGSNRPIKMYFNHNSNEIIGGFPVDKIKDDENGLYVEGQINLGVQKGREAYSLAKQGVMQDFSIGYTVDDYDLKNGVRQLKTLELWEISMVGEPMNPEARILTVKNNKKPDTAKVYHFDDVNSLKDKRDLEKLLRDSGAFSRKAATYLSSLFDVKQSDSVDEIAMNEVKNLLNYLTNRG